MDSLRENDKQTQNCSQPTKKMIQDGPILNLSWHNYSDWHKQWCHRWGIPSGLPVQALSQSSKNFCYSKEEYKPSCRGGM